MSVVATLPAPASPPHIPDRPIVTEPPSAADDSAALPTSLVPNRFSVELCPLDSAEQHYRFRNHLEERDAWLRILPDIEDSSSRVSRHEACGAVAWIVHSDSRGEYRVRSQCCGLRICPICSERLRHDQAVRLKGMLADLKPHEWKFITLTMQHSSAPLKQQHDNLRKCFRRLRQRKVWKDHTDYGYAVIETTFRPLTGHWHPHLHVLCRSKYIPQEVLSKNWCQITCGSFIVDVRQVNHADGAAHYIADYMAQTPRLDDLDDIDARLAEYYEALDGAHLLIRFGAHPPVDDDDDDDGSVDDWRPIAPLAAVLDAAEHGDTKALELLHTLERNPAHAYLVDNPHPT